MQNQARPLAFFVRFLPALWLALAMAAACSDLPVPLLVSVDGAAHCPCPPPLTCDPVLQICVNGGPSAPDAGATAKADATPDTKAAAASTACKGNCGKPAVAVPCGTSAMALIPAGVFKMGCVPGDTLCHPNEFPQHSVWLSPYCIDKREVTVASYAQCVAMGICSKPAEGSGFNWGIAGRGQHPINGVSFEQAKVYCQSMVPGGELPTEAQWEKAARNGLQGKRYPWGDAPLTCAPGLPNSAVWSETSDGCGTYGTWPVGTGSSATAFGLFDLAGNVWEWTADPYLKDYYGQSPGSDPKGPAKAEFRVVRGGSYAGDPANLRASRRGFENPYGGQYRILGFRCAKPQP